MKKNLILLHYLFIALSFCLDMQAQPSSGGSEAEQETFKNAIGLYYKFIGENSHLYSGSEYVSPVYNREMHPFFQTFEFSNAEIYYEGVLYTNIPAMYDILKDEVVINRYQQNFRIVLNGDKISSFSILGHFFVRLLQDSLNQGFIKTGFYDRLYNGRVRTYVQRRKKLEENIIQNQSVFKIVEADRYLVERDKIFYAVNGRKNLLNALGDHKKEIRKYLRKNKISFYANKENTILLASQYHDQLVK
jgi:hypothetical protein